MDTINRLIMTKLAKRFWNYDDSKVDPITEVISVDWCISDEYIRINGYLYFEEDPDEYVHFIAHSYRIDGHGLITEFDCYTYDDSSCYFYWVSELNNILPKDIYENWECQVSMLNEEE